MKHSNRQPQSSDQGFGKPEVAGVTPLSYAQQRVWLSQQLDPKSPVYNVYQTWRIRGALDSDVLERTLQAIIHRHGALRTVVRVVDAAPCQVILEPRPYELAIEDLRGRSFEDLETVCTEIARDEVNRPFDLTMGPLIRAKLWRLGDEDYVFLLNMHHIVTDGWTFAVIHREMGVLYGAFAGGNALALPDLPLEYRDYAVEQREYLEADVLGDQLGYWKERLADLSPLRLPTDRPGNSWSTFKGGREGFSLGQALSQKVKSLSREEGVSLFTTLLACFKVLLFRYSGQTDVAVGTFKHGRTRGELESLVGMFVNTLVLRTDFSGDPSFLELLQDVRKTCKGAFTHEELPFDLLVDELQPERQVGRNPLFQVSINYHASVVAPDFPDLTVSQFTVGRFGSSQLRNDTAKFDLELTWYDSEHEVEGLIEYSTDLFDRSTIRRVIAHLRMLIEAIVTDPSRPVSRLPLLTEAERRRLLVEWNATETAFPHATTLAERFEAQVAATPGRVAVVFGDLQLTYRELHDRASHLAGFLSRHSEIGPDVCVGLCTERSIEMVVGILGILKAGGAYVPLDPDAPPGRLAFMIHDAGIDCLLTQDHLRAELPDFGGTVLALDADWDMITQARGGSVESGVTADNLAYVIYTSGSTGVPKGVMISQGAISNHMDWMQRAFPLTETDCIAQKTPFAFDASVWEFFAPLLVGARLAVAGKDGHRDPSYLARFVTENNVTILQVVPTFLRQLLEESLPSNGSLQRLFCGGEVLPIDLVGRWCASSSATLINLYGPTETAIDALSRVCGDPERFLSVPVGRPVANTQAYVLDSAMQPVPIGVSGELYLGGRQLARGYVGRADLTAERFLPDPFSPAPGARLYKTGDLVRFRADGDLEYLGRIDHQIKIRGFRIELGEIETVLGELPLIRETVVIVREDSPGDKRIVAYVVPSDGPRSHHDLRQALKQRLPDYMVPAHFVTLKALPLMPNGKVDRKALPAPSGTRESLETIYVAPSTPIEQQLVAIWQEVLGSELVGVKDNFFELGGNSLLATQVVSRVREALQVELKLQHFFELPSIAGLAGALEILNSSTRAHRQLSDSTTEKRSEILL
jgi:amino acid adenylation domain-containing protein